MTTLTLDEIAAAVDSPRVREDLFNYHHQNNPQYQGRPREQAWLQFELDMQQPDQKKAMINSFAPHDVDRPSQEHDRYRFGYKLNKALLAGALGLIAFIGGFFVRNENEIPKNVLLGGGLVTMGIGAACGLYYNKKRQI